MATNLPTATIPCENVRLVEEMSRMHELISQLHAIVLPLTSCDRSSKLIRHLFEDAFESCSFLLSALQNCSPSQEVDSDDLHRGKRKVNSWTIATTVPHNDGHEWRKYGQKKIIGSTFQRSYYRCALHKEHGCSATKTVQQKDGDAHPPKFVVTYNANHTCKIDEKGNETSSHPASIQLDCNRSNNRSSDAAVFTELDIEELLYEPRMDEVPNITSPSWEFNVDDVWENMDALFS